jgi:hypothetical protein
MDFEKPDTSHLVLKPKEIVPTDSRSLPGDGKAISVRLIHAQNRIAEEKASTRKKQRGAPPPLLGKEPGPPPGFRASEIDRVNAPALPGDEDAVSVPGILQENVAAEVESGLARVTPRKRRLSRRTRDFVLLVGSIDAAIIVYMKIAPSTVTFVYGIAGITLVTSMIGWVAFVVMDDY